MTLEELESKKQLNVKVPYCQLQPHKNSTLHEQVLVTPLPSEDQPTINKPPFQDHPTITKPPFENHPNMNKPTLENQPPSDSHPTINEPPSEDNPTDNQQPEIQPTTRQLPSEDNPNFSQLPSTSDHQPMHDCATATDDVILVREVKKKRKVGPIAIVKRATHKNKLVESMNKRILEGQLMPSLNLRLGSIKWSGEKSVSVYIVIVVNLPSPVYS